VGYHRKINVFKELELESTVKEIYTTGKTGNLNNRF